VSKNLKRLFGRTSLVLVESLAVLAVLLAIVLGIAVVALRSGPVNINFAEDYIEGALVNEESGGYAVFENAALSWPAFDAPFMLGLDKVKVMRSMGEGQVREIISVEHVTLGLSKNHLLGGQIRPVSLVLSELSFDVLRDKQGRFDIGFGDMELPEHQIEEVVSEAQTSLLEDILNYIGSEEDGEGSSPLSNLELFEIRDAKLQYLDQGYDFFADFYAREIVFESVPEGLAAQAQLRMDPADGDQDSALYLDALLLRESKTLELSSRLENFDVAQLVSYGIEDEEILAVLQKQNVVLDAQIDGVFDEHLSPEAVDFALRSAAGDMQIDYMSDEKLPYSDLRLGGSFRQEKDGGVELSLADSGVTVKGVTLGLSGRVIEENGGYRAPLRITSEEIRQDRVAPLWPQGLDEDMAREWIVERLSAGTFRDVEAQMELLISHSPLPSLPEEEAEVQEAEPAGWQVDARNVRLGLSMADMDVEYRAPLALVQDARAQAEFLYDEEKLSIVVEEGTIGDMVVDNATLDFNTILQSGKGTVDVQVDLRAGLSDVFRYIETEPIGVDHRFDVSQLKGDAVLKVGVAMPTTKDVTMEQVKISVEGQVENAVLPGVVRDLALTGGPFSVSVDSEKASVNGSGLLAGRAIDVQWMEFLQSAGKSYKSRITANLKADEALRDEFGIDLSDFLEGEAGLDVTYTEYQGGKALADIDVDLFPARLFVEPFDYNKKTGITGKATLRAMLQDGELKEIDGLRVNAPGLSLADGRMLFAGQGEALRLAKGSLPQVEIGETRAEINFEIEPESLTKIWLQGDVLDLRPFLKSEEQEEGNNAAQDYDSPPLVLSLEAQQMITADNAAVAKGKIYADIDGKGRFNQLEMDAVAGAGDIYMRYKPDETGARTFRLEADDAGAALKAFGLYENIRGGKLTIYAEPIAGVYDRNLVGLAEITDFRVVKAPGLARLLSAMSLPGVTQLLNNEGVVFSKLESNFDWVYRPRGSVLVLKNGRTSGNSLGLTFDGIYNQQTSQIDMNGTIIPLSGINKMLGSVPVIGDILGGAGGVFAATYTIKGEGDEPEIRVNPLSVLAPGILRRILFE